MIRESPCKYYTKYLILEGYSNDEIQSHLQTCDLDYIGDWYTQALREGLEQGQPEPFYPKDGRHAPSQAFLTQERVRSLYIRDTDTKKAFRLLEQPRLKEFVETMTLSGASDQHIAMALRKKYGFSATAKTMSRYRHYFWKIELLDSNDKRALIPLRVASLASNPDPIVQAQAVALKKAYFKDPRRAAVDLPAAPVSAVVAGLRLGTLPSRMDLATLMEHTRAVATARAFEAVCHDGPDDPARARDYALVAKVFTEVLEVASEPDEDIKEGLKGVLIENATDTVPTIRQLSGGNFTTELQPIETDGKEVGDSPNGNGTD